MHIPSLPQPASKPAPLTKYRPHIVVAEDDRELRSLLSDVLTADGYAVVAVGSGLALLEELRVARMNEAPPALLISDIRIPAPSGLAVLRTLRAWGWMIPAIVLSGFADEATRLEAMRAGATCLLRKPFDLDDLRAAVLLLLPPAAPFLSAR